MRFAMWKWLVITFAVAVLGGCSGSSSVDNGGGTTGAAPSSNWDSMIWDQGKWQ